MRKIDCVARWGFFGFGMKPNKTMWPNSDEFQFSNWFNGKAIHFTSNAGFRPPPHWIACDEYEICSRFVDNLSIIVHESIASLLIFIKEQNIKPIVLDIENHMNNSRSWNSENAEWWQRRKPVRLFDWPKLTLILYGILTKDVTGNGVQICHFCCCDRRKSRNNPTCQSTNNHLLLQISSQNLFALTIFYFNIFAQHHTPKRGTQNAQHTKPISMFP